MEPIQLLVIAVLVVLVAVVAWFAYERQRSNKLRERFGSEYDRAVGNLGDRRRAESELEARAERVRGLQIRPLDPQERERFADAWRGAQARFVDEPGPAVADADRLVGEVMQARGYPVEEFEQRAADVSVDHPQVVDHYRTAHAIAERERGAQTPDTEALRQAMVHYRALFSDLLETSGDDTRTADDDTRAADAATRDTTTSGRRG